MSTTESSQDTPGPALAPDINIEQALKSHREWARHVRSFHDLQPKHCLHLRIQPREKRLLERELGRWKNHIEGESREVDDSLIVQVAMLLFLRWSWASDTLRAVLKSLISMLSQPNIPPDRHMRILGRSLACRDHAGLLPYDVRQDRVNLLMTDPDNLGFWDVMRRTPELLRDSVREIAVVPHSDDWGAWQSLARLAIDKYTFFNIWRGFGEAAVHVYERCPGGTAAVRQHVLKDEYDVWEIWILVRLLERCRVLENDFIVEEETREIFKRIGNTHLGYPYMIECVGYHTEKITNISRISFRNTMLASVSLGAPVKSTEAPVKSTEDWDLVIIHYQTPGDHNKGFYVSEDVANRWDEEPLPGQYAQCDCEHTGGEAEECWTPKWDGSCSGGSLCYQRRPALVYSRRKLDDVILWQNMNRYWTAWNDCLLVRGSGLNKDHELQDPDTIYVLETLPGIKARQLRQHAASMNKKAWMEGMRRANLFFNLKLHQSPIRLGMKWFDRKLPRGGRPHPALHDFLSEFQASEFDLRVAEELGDSARATVYLVPWDSAPRYDRFGDMITVQDKAIIKIIGHNWWHSDNKVETESGVGFFRRLLYLSESGITGNRVKNTVQLVGYAKFPVQDLLINSVHKDGYQGADFTQRLTDQLDARPEHVYGLVFEHAQGGPLLQTVKKHFRDWDTGETHRSDEFVQTFAVENWYTILRFMYQIGTALRDLPVPHRAVTASNIFLRHRAYPPEIFSQVVKTKPFLDRYRAVLGEPSPPEEGDDMFWGFSDYPRPVNDPDCDRGEDAMKFGYFAGQLIAEAMPGLADIRQYPGSHNGDEPPRLVFADIIKFIDLIRQAKETRNNRMAIKTMNDMLAFIKGIVVDKRLRLDIRRRVSEALLEQPAGWCWHTLAAINPENYKFILLKIGLHPNHPEINVMFWGNDDDDNEMGDDDGLDKDRTKDLETIGIPVGRDNPEGNHSPDSSNSPVTKKKDPGCETDGAETTADSRYPSSTPPSNTGNDAQPKTMGNGVEGFDEDDIWRDSDEPDLDSPIENSEDEVNDDSEEHVTEAEKDSDEGYLAGGEDE